MRAARGGGAAAHTATNAPLARLGRSSLISEEDVVFTESLLTELNRAHGYAQMGWAGAVFILKRTKLGDRAGEAVAETVKQRPKIVPMLFGRN